MSVLVSDVTPVLIGGGFVGVVALLAWAGRSGRRRRGAEASSDGGYVSPADGGDGIFLPIHGADPAFDAGGGDFGGGGADGGWGGDGGGGDGGGGGGD